MTRAEKKRLWSVIAEELQRAGYSKASSDSMTDVLYPHIVAEIDRAVRKARREERRRLRGMYWDEKPSRAMHLFSLAPGRDVCA